MSTSETITRTDLTNILNEVLPVPPLNELIYSGSFTTGTTTLQKSVVNYVKIVIVYEDNDSTTHTKVVITDKALSFTTVCSVLRVTGMDYKKGIIVSFNGTSMNVQSNKQGAGTATPTDGSYITIKKVYGVRAIDSDAIAEQADYIVEQGTSGIWTYRKWNSGIAECWGKATVTPTWVAYPISGLYYSSPQPTVSYPFNITNALVLVNPTEVGSNVGWVANVSPYVGSVGFTIVRNGNTGAATVQLSVKGKWK